MDKAQPLMLTSGASGRVRALFSVQVFKTLILVFYGLLMMILRPFRRSSSATAAEKSSASMVVRVPAAMVRRSPVAKEKEREKERENEVRRKMAIQRLREIDDDEEAHKSLREYNLFSTSRNDTLFTQSWTPIGIETRGIVVLMHGLNEHSGRYNCFARELNANGFKVYAMDWIGHGGSDWLHGYVHSLDYAVDDLKIFLKKLMDENPGLPFFCFGHSTGAAIVLKTILDPKVEDSISGVVVTSPAVSVQASHPIVAAVAPIVSFLLPKYQFSAANKKGPPVSRDKQALKIKYSDPLVFTGAIRIRTGYEILRITYHLQQNLCKINTPFLVLHGTADTVTDPLGSKKLYEEASATDKSIKLYDGYLHDLLFELERDNISKDIIDWLCSRLNGRQ